MRVAVAVTWYGDGNSVEVEGVVQVCVCVVCTVVHDIHVYVCLVVLQQ